MKPRTLAGIVAAGWIAEWYMWRRHQRLAGQINREMSEARNG
jgi:hypothetical protein